MKKIIDVNVGVKFDEEQIEIVMNSVFIILEDIFNFNEKGILKLLKSTEGLLKEISAGGISPEDLREHLIERINLEYSSETKIKI